MKTVDAIKMVPTSEIRPYENNPRNNTRTVDLLVKIIPKVGFNVPLVLDKDNVIVKGHARFYAAQKLGMKEVPCVISDADADAIKADRIADNKVHEFSRWLDEELLHEVDMLDLDFDFKEFGLPELKIPTAQFDFIDDFYDEPENAENDEERRARFAKLMAQIEEEEQNARQQSFVTQTAINNAKDRQKNVAKAPPKYYSVKCEKCGKTIYVRDGDEMVWL